jgi:hypothetical protein
MSMTMHRPHNEEEFQQLMTGGLAGWKMLGAGNFIELGGNIIESNGGTGLLWYPHKQFENFILRAEWQVLAVTDNSGIFIRFPNPGTDLSIPITQGYEVQIDNTRRNPDTGTLNDPLHQTGAIYKLAPSHAVPAIGQWHTCEIEAKGTHHYGSPKRARGERTQACEPLAQRLHRTSKSPRRFTSSV